MPHRENGKFYADNENMLLSLQFFLVKDIFWPKRSKIPLAWTFTPTHRHMTKLSGFTNKEILRKPFAELQQNREAREV